MLLRPLHPKLRCEAATNALAQECSPESSNVSERMNAPTRTGRSEFAEYDPGVQVSNDRNSAQE